MLDFYATVAKSHASEVELVAYQLPWLAKRLCRPQKNATYLLRDLSFDHSQPNDARKPDGLVDTVVEHLARVGQEDVTEPLLNSVGPVVLANRSQEKLSIARANVLRTSFL